MRVRARSRTFFLQLLLVTRCNKNLYNQLTIADTILCTFFSAFECCCCWVHAVLNAIKTEYSKIFSMETEEMWEKDEKMCKRERKEYFVLEMYFSDGFWFCIYASVELHTCTSLKCVKHGRKFIITKISFFVNISSYWSLVVNGLYSLDKSILLSPLSLLHFYALNWSAAMNALEYACRNDKSTNNKTQMQ